MSFRKTFDVLREAAGSYVNGLYVAGVKSALSIQASIQPVTEQDLITAPEGRRISDMIKVYTNTSLQEGGEETNLQPDLIAWRGYAYEVNSVSVRQMGVINHYKIYATRRMAAPGSWSDIILNNVNFVDNIDLYTGNIPANGITNDNQPTLSGTATLAVNSVNIYDDATLIGTATVTNGNWSFTPSVALTEGVHTLSAKAVDAEGNEAFTTNALLTFTVDVTAVTAPTLAEYGSNKLGDYYMNAAEAATLTTVRATLATAGILAVIGDKIELKLSGVSFASPKVVTLNANHISAGYVDFAFTYADLIADGAKSLTAVLADVAGNTSASPTMAFMLDTAAPPGPALLLGPNVVYGANLARATQSEGVVTATVENGATATITFTSGVGHVVTKTITGNGNAKPVVLLAGDLGSGATQISDGTITVTAVATDIAGNVSSTSANQFLLDTRTDANFSMVSLLLKGEGVVGDTAFFDSSSYGIVLAASGTPVISAASPKFGFASMYFNGASYAYKITPGAGFDFGTGDFAAEAWVTLDDVTGVQTVAGRANATGTAMALRVNAGVPELYLRSAGGVETVVQGTSNGALTAAGTIATGSSPTSVAISSDGNNVYVANQNGETLSIYSRASNGALTAAGTIATNSKPYIVVVSPDGNNVYVSNQNGNTLSIYSRGIGGTLTSLGPIATGGTPLSIAVSPDGLNVYVSCETSNILSIYSRASNGALTAAGTIATGSRPYFVAVSPDGNNVYVANLGEDSLRIYNRAGNGALTVAGSVAMGIDPTSVAISSDGTSVYVANSGSDTLSIYSRAIGGALTLLNTIATSAKPRSVVVSPDGNNVYVSNQNGNTLSIYSRASNGALTATGTIATGSNPYFVAVAFDGLSVYVPNYGSDTLSIYTRAQQLSIPALTPTYIKASRTSGTFALQVGSEVVATQALALPLDFDPASRITVGSQYTSAASNYLRGKIDELRITKGDARAGGEPTQGFPAA